MDAEGFLKVTELVQSPLLLEERVIYDLLHEVVPDDFLLQLVLAPGMFPTEELQERFYYFNLLQLLVGSEVVLCPVVFRARGSGRRRSSGGSLT